MLWLGLVLLALGGCVYAVIRMDRKLKAKFEDKFNPSDWELPRSVELTAEIKPQPMGTSAMPIANQATAALHYQKKPSIFADAQRQVFNALQQAVSDDYLLLSNVNVADVLSVSTNNVLAVQVATKNMAARQFDFVICTKTQLSAVCAIVIGDSLEPLLVTACENAGLPLVRFKIQASYDAAVIRANLLKALGSLEEVADVVVMSASDSGLDIIDSPFTYSPFTDKSIPTNESVKTEQKKSEQAENVVSPSARVGSGINLELCPHCSSVMLKRKAKNGAAAGQLFWICSGYPKCRGMIPIK